MNLEYRRGRAEAPSGHALVYFTGSADGGVLATYLVVLPIALQLAKYVPPMLAAQLPLAEVQGLSAVPLPPLPEAVESYEYLVHLADLRRDDLIHGGEINPGDLSRAMALVGEIAQTYASAYDSYLRASPMEASTEDAEADTTVSDVIYGLMSEQQKLAELAKLAGQLRYAVDGGDLRQVEETVDEVRRLERHVPSSYDLGAFLDAARLPGPIGQRLSTLYLDRCYKLAAEDYGSLQTIDQEIRRLRDESAG